MKSERLFSYGKGRLSKGGPFPLLRRIRVTDAPYSGRSFSAHQNREGTHTMKLLNSIAAAVAVVALSASADAKVLPKPAKSDTVQSYILLDRTGSMSDIWDEALTSVNAYADSFAADAPGAEIAGADIKTAVTVAIRPWDLWKRIDSLISTSERPSP